MSPDSSFKVRIDRVDRLADDARVLIDYKTGAATTDWRGDRPDNPQLPIYALAASRSIGRRRVCACEGRRTRLCCRGGATGCLQARRAHLGVRGNGEPGRLGQRLVAADRENRGGVRGGARRGCAHVEGLQELRLARTVQGAGRRSTARSDR